MINTMVVLGLIILIVLTVAGLMGLIGALLSTKIGENIIVGITAAALLSCVVVAILRLVGVV